VEGNGGGAVELGRSRRKGKIDGAHLSAGRGEGRRRPEKGRFPAMEAEIGQARGPTGPMERGGVPGKSGPT
jgi:hypothetical protein